jgi:UDP-N-acetylglucosamine transferase subunit ALG13
MSRMGDASVPGDPQAPAPLVLCVVGTDHHHFTRLVSWCDALAERRPDVDVLVQHGASAPPRTARGVAFLGKAELESTLRSAHVAICHGGPGSISDVRSAGLLPLVVPRDPRLDEHVDGHQQRFVRRFSSTGAIVEVHTRDELLERVETALSQPRGAGRDTSVEDGQVRASVDRFARLVDNLVARAHRSRR